MFVKDVSRHMSLVYDYPEIKPISKEFSDNYKPTSININSYAGKTYCKDARLVMDLYQDNIISRKEARKLLDTFSKRLINVSEFNYIFDSLYVRKVKYKKKRNETIELGYYNEKDLVPNPKV